MTDADVMARYEDPWTEYTPHRDTLRVTLYASGVVRVECRRWWGGWKLRGTGVWDHGQDVRLVELATGDRFSRDDEHRVSWKLRTELNDALVAARATLVAVRTAAEKHVARVERLLGKATETCS